MLQLTLIIGTLAAAIHIVPRIILNYRRRRMTALEDRRAGIFDYPELSLLFVGLIGAIEFIGAPGWLLPFALLFLATRVVTAAGPRVPAPVWRGSIFLAILLLLLLMGFVVLRGIGYV